MGRGLKVNFGAVESVPECAQKKKKHIQLPFDTRWNCKVFQLVSLEHSTRSDVVVEFKSPSYVHTQHTQWIYGSI